MCRRARADMRHAMEGTGGPSRYASDHMLGYVDNYMELKMLQRMLLTERRVRCR